MKTSLKHVLSLALIATVAFNAQAGTVVCSGTVAQLVYNQPGLLSLKLSSMNVPVFICMMDGDWSVPGSLAGVTSPAACKVLYGTLLSAKLTGTTINSMYFDGNQVPTACNSFPNDVQVNVRHFEY